MDEDWIRVIAAAALAEGAAVAVELMGLNLAVYRVDGAFYCTDNVCSHGYALLSDGWLHGHFIECWLHHGHFDVRTGKAAGAPITVDIRSYKVRIDGADLQIRLPA